MSPDRAAEGASRWIAVLVLVLTLLAAALLWVFVPRDLGSVTVERAQVLTRDNRIAITFAVPRDLATVRDGTGLGYVAARLSDCGDAAGAALEVIDQRAEYLRDRDRVRRLPDGPGGSVRYRALFDDSLAKLADHRFRFTPADAAPDGLCFLLYGASMGFRQGRSNTVKLDLRR